MNSRISFLTTLFIFFTVIPGLSQEIKKDKAEFEKYQNEYWQKIKKSADEYNKKEKEPREVFKMDFSSYDLPTAVDQFTQQ